MNKHEPSIKSIQRFPLYLAYLKTLPPEVQTISATHIAWALGLGDVQVRKDLALVEAKGRPKTGYQTTCLIKAIEKMLSTAGNQVFCIVGMGHLGRALANHQGFRDLGLKLAAAFDLSPEDHALERGDFPLYEGKELERICKAKEIKVGVITVPPAQAQTVCDRLIAGGVVAIWNFSSTHLQTPQHIHVECPNMAARLGILSRRLQTQIRDTPPR